LIAAVCVVGIALSAGGVWLALSVIAPREVAEVETKPATPKKTSSSKKEPSAAKSAPALPATSPAKTPAPAQSVKPPAPQPAEQQPNFTPPPAIAEVPATTVIEPAPAPTTPSPATPTIPPPENPFVPVPTVVPVPEPAPKVQPATPPQVARLPDVNLPGGNAPAERSFEPSGVKLEADLVQQLVALHEGKKLLIKKEYPTVRKLFADRFEKMYGDQLKHGWGAEAEEVTKWLSDHPEIREELYTAIDPEADRIPAVATIFNELRKKFPDKIVPYFNLAIATAVVWDAERPGVYDYSHHASRCKATIPADLLTAVDNFEYLVSAESVMQGRIQFVPWEFLIYVVNHKTPKQERGWAMQNFLGRRAMFGKCYSDVPYDHEMLRTQSASAQLNGKEYTLPNILQFGGVCAMQADFAARVGKSIGVASEYVRGESAGGELHAWVMWIELKQATPTGLVFSMESHGRYRGDKYYVGHLTEPQLGQPITDRDMELRLQTVGLDTVSKRHAKLVMQAYDSICEAEKLDTTKKLVLLHQVIQYNPGCEDAWLAVARLARESNGEKQYSKQFQAVLNHLFTTFATIPDFTWKVFADLAVYYPEGKARASMYELLIQMYESAARPDLACEARLAWAEMIAPQDRKLDAVLGLAASIKKFPGEGRYIPRLLDKLEQLCTEVKDAEQHLVQFYADILPTVPQTRGDSPSPFALKMFERGIGVFQKYNQPQLAAAAQAEMEKIKSGNGRREKPQN
jgi:hypothetical protein